VKLGSEKEERKRRDPSNDYISCFSLEGYGRDRKEEKVDSEMEREIEGEEEEGDNSTGVIRGDVDEETVDK
jgi:hypothetical protein